MSKAFWICPDGEIIDIGNQTHIAYIIKHPAIFNTTKSKITKLYKQYDEPLGIEATARKEIIMNLIEQGFIRIRLYPKTHWSISLNKWNIQNQSIISKWAEIVLNMKNADQYMPVVISTVDGWKYDFTVKELLLY